MSSSDMNRLKRKKAAGSRTDKGWEHGIDVDGNSKKVKCKYCQKIFSGGIYRFKHHLACTHDNVEACLSVPDNVKREFWVLVSQLAERKKKKNLDDDSQLDSQEIEQPLSTNRKGKGIMDAFSQKTKIGDKQVTLNQMFKKDLREEACQQIARFFYTSAIPFNCVKNPEFVKMFELAIRHGPGFKPPSYHEMREKYLKKEVANTTSLLEEYKLEWKKTGCSVMSDGWSDKKRRSIVNFLVNSPKGTVFISSLDTSDVSKTAEVVCKMLDDIIEQVGEENVVQVVTDNAANYKAAGEMLMEKRQRLYWTPCAAHCIDLMLEDFEKKVPVHSETITKGKKITNFIYGRVKLISMLRDFTKGKDLVRAVVTRFATSYLNLGSLNDHRGALMSMFSSDDWKKSRYAATVDGKKIIQIVLDGEFWKNVSICLRAAYPLIKVLRLVDSDEKPAMRFIYDAMDAAKQKIRENFNNVRRSSSGCERNWSAFEMVHTKRRNRLHQQKMNDLVFVMYNLRLKERKTRIDDNTDATFEDLDSDNEWIAEDCESNDLVVGDRLRLLADSQIEEKEDDDSTANLEENSTQRRGDDLEINDAFDVEEDDIGLNVNKDISIRENMRDRASNESSGVSEFASNEIGDGGDDVGIVGEADNFF